MNEVEPSTKRILDERFEEKLKISNDLIDKKLDAQLKAIDLAASLGISVNDLFINPPDWAQPAKNQNGTRREIVNEQIIDIVEDR
jgi:hypothetical protein